MIGTRLFTLAAVAVAVVASSAHAALTGDVCHAYSEDIESPCTEVVAQKEGYEIRAYAKKDKPFWTSAKVEAQNWGVVQTVGFWKNYMYISGNNEGGITMPMTSPVLFRPPSDSNGGEWEVSFFLSSEISKNDGKDIPQPKADDIDIVELKPEGGNADSGVLYAVIEFGGFAQEGDFKEQQDKLMSMLSSDIKLAPEGPWSVVWASYDSPMQLKNRHNEVWLQVENSQETSDYLLEG